MSSGKQEDPSDLTEKDLLRYAFICSIPIMCSYLFLGMAYGILLEEAGLKWFHAVLASVTVYTGAFQFVLTSLLSAGASFATIALTCFFMSSRQTFYALSFVEDFNQMGRWKPYMIFSLTDETYAVNCSLALTGEKKRKVMAPLALMCHIYWITGSLVGAVLGQLIPFSMEGIDFCMTALFVIIFIDQWEKARSHVPALIGLCAAVICLFVFGESRFMLPALLIVSALLVVYNGRNAGKAVEP